ncbi:hypothetical protein HMN09_00025100 [Mycena chlorophos]|uniref:Uncharacterized protein n=1 Tax=Mycena chlorophos TaxID=658473 RepID=A0A8H6TP04_MYCCL|nr:hypothetical protein HMN09_00025100 [Mycena chlorophos]
MASSSTTETKTYVLEKYSRAYATKQTDAGSSEWQHFTNPLLRLVLDVKMSPTKAESFRLRVVWTMSGAGQAEQDVILEDLDLLAFSSLDDSFKSESSPLKGVYRETTFGLRYLYVPESSEARKVYRRFQVSLPSAAATMQLVEVIRVVCPCKTTEPGALERKKTKAVGAIARPPRPTQHAPVQPQPTVHFTEPEPIPVPVPEVEMRPSSPVVEPEQSQLPPPPTPESENEPPPPTPSNPVQDIAMDTEAETEKLLASLQHATNLYDLSYGQLARLVGDVVREDGFPRLMENLSSMWSVKALAGSM